MLRRFTWKPILSQLTVPIIIGVSIILVLSIILLQVFPIIPFVESIQRIPGLYWPVEIALLLVLISSILGIIVIIWLAGRDNYLWWRYSCKFEKIFGFKPPTGLGRITERGKLQQRVHQLLREKAEKINQCITPSSFFKLPTPAIPQGKPLDTMVLIEASRQKNMKRLNQAFYELTQAIPAFYEALWLADLFGFQVLKGWVQYIP